MKKEIKKWLKENQLVIYGTGIAVLGGFGLYKLYMAGVEKGADLFEQNMALKQVTFIPEDKSKQPLLGIKVLYGDKLVKSFYMDEEDSVATAKEIYENIIRSTE